MSATRTAWHVWFALYVKETAPPDAEVRFEVILTTEPQRGDLLLLRRGELRSDEAKALRGLWPLLRGDTILEYKSFARPLRAGDLARLQGYGAQYFADEIGKRSLALSELSLVLAVSNRTPTLTAELARMGWTMTPISTGCMRASWARGMVCTSSCWPRWPRRKRTRSQRCSAGLAGPRSNWLGGGNTMRDPWRT